MFLVYIAGPYRGKTMQEVELNIASAKQIAKIVARKGYMPVTPHLNTQGFEHIAPDLPDEFWLEGTLEILRRCDYVVLAPGWELSSGTRKEIEVAKSLSIPVIENVYNLEEYINTDQDMDYI